MLRAFGCVLHTVEQVGNIAAANAANSFAGELNVTGVSSTSGTAQVSASAAVMLSHMICCPGLACSGGASCRSSTRPDAGPFSWKTTRL